MKYCELHCKTNYSFLSGASHADELVQTARELGYSALAITDENSLAGIVRAYTAIKQTSPQSQRALKLIIGAEITPHDAPPVVLWATDRNSYAQLTRLITIGRRRAPKGECWLRFEDIAQNSTGLLAGVLPNLTGDRDHTAHITPIHPSYPWYVQGTILNDGPEPTSGLRDLHRYRELMGDRAYLLAELYRGIDDAARIEQLKTVAATAELPLVAAGDVLYHSPARLPLHDVLTAIKHKTTVAQAGHLLLPNAQRHLQTRQQRYEAFASIPGALARTIEIAQRCSFCLSQLRYEYPEELAPDGQTPIQYLRQLTQTGCHTRYPQGPPAAVQIQIDHELRLIEELNYEAYFLTVWDLVRFARGRNILCQGRGSAANSAVCYCLGVTSVDPATTDLLFERFVSKERDEAPDIDVDFEHERREEVLQYLYQKYGRTRAGLAATVITYRHRSAIRDVGKALGFSPDRVDALAKHVSHGTDQQLAQRMEEVGVDPHTPSGQRLEHLVTEIVGFPRHLSQHVGGMVITRGKLDELVPIENAAMDDRTVIQWDKNDLEEIGLLKVDCLCLGMLSAIAKCFAMIEQHWHRPLTLATVPAEDPLVYDMVCKADTVGVFQIESRAQMSMLPRLKPRCWYDLVIEVALVRPGPIQGNMVHPYLRRRNGEEQVSYPNEAIKAVLQRTLGVPIFQEQAMKLAVVAAGFTPGEADQLRRAMGTWRNTGMIEKFRHKLMEGMRKNGLQEEFAERVFKQICGFGEYGFPESHAASFAQLVYVSAWLKHYYPAAFAAAIINSQPMGFYAPAQLVDCAKKHGVNVLPVDVNHSDWDCTLESPGEGDIRSPALRLGLRMISGLRETHAHTMVNERGREPFTSVADLTKRTRLGSAVVTRLSQADAFQSIDHDRRKTLWQALAQEQQPLAHPLFDALSAHDDPVSELPPLPLQQQVAADYQTVGLSLKAHPISFHRDFLNELKLTTSAGLVELRNNQHVRLAGLVILRQRPATAKGIIFVTLEDETGTANLVIKKDVWDRYYKIARRKSAWIVHGKLEKKSGVIHVLVSRVEDLSQRLDELNIKSRDFR